MASVNFFSEDNYQNHGRAFNGGYQAVNDLSEWYYNNSTYKMGGTINSMKTGDNTWVCLFTGTNFEKSTVKVGPNQNISNLHDYHDLNGDGFRNAAYSFVMYESKPNFWDVVDNYNTGDCWVKLYHGQRFVDTEFCLEGANLEHHTGETINTSCINGYRSWGGNYVYNYPQSLTTGQGTWVRLYKEVEFKNQIAQFGPNSIIPYLNKYGSINVNSIRVYSAEPNDWEHDSSITPQMPLAIEKYLTGQNIESLVAGALSCIPYVGGLAKGILSAFWPSSPYTVEVWNDLDSYMTMLVNGLISQYNIDYLNSTLQGLGGSIETYSNLLPSGEKAEGLHNILDALDQDKSYFYSVSNPENNLTYMVEFGMMTILMLAERVYNYTVLSGGETDSNYQAYANQLDTTINEFTNAVVQAKKAAIDWRVGFITVNDNTSKSANYTLSDAYTGYSAEFSNQFDADNAKNNLANDTTLLYDQLLEAKISPSYLWVYLQTANTTNVADSGNTNFPTTTFKTLPTQQTIQVTTGTYGSIDGAYFIDNCNGHRISGLTLYTKYNCIGGIQWHFENQGSDLHGYADSSLPTTIMFDADEYITSIYGGYGSCLVQFFIRTNKGRDFGIGGAAGYNFIAAPPQGMNAQITSISGYVSSYYINQLALNWAYTVWK